MRKEGRRSGRRREWGVGRGSEQGRKKRGVGHEKKKRRMNMSEKRIEGLR